MAIINTPLAAGKITFKNRLVYPPITIAKASPDGKVTEDSLEYYQDKMRGGHFSLAIVEHCYITQQGKASAGQVSIADDSKIQGLAKLARVIKGSGTKAVVQMNHAGSCTTQEVTGMKLAGPSPVKNPRQGGVPEEMTKADISRVVSAFAAAAARGKAAGYDGVEIHSAHSYLLNQFYSPLTNLRNDQYGGKLENRISIHLEIIDAVRKAVGRDYPVFLRLGACDYLPGGNKTQDAVKAARIFEDAGIDVLDISGGMCGYVNPENKAPGYFGAESKAIREAVSIPVISTGGVKEAEDVEALLEAGVADLIGVGRTVMKDSAWAGRTIAFYR
ncbi:NADH:flavin oxidoreductase [Anaerovorax odorimutans]|uniref:NADH:flavin oxidoreductase n=1 Tax=Anaerovorax odorimutans TaxID=109327 RepID=A0ABT1RN79_9FIRM|nr:NADH:flavin oxidoreductase [Anaerovorax odorimutans]MCQ4636629.1 NADH:flavin oxidoreductase [Anaerovorax odorimutans]